jgi:hypothetical protein
MTTNPSSKTDSTTPQLAGEFKAAERQEGDGLSACSSSNSITVPPLVDTVFAKSSEQRTVTVNVSRIEASLESLQRNRRLQELRLG